MTSAELLDAAKLRARKASSDKLDAEIQQLIDTSLADLKRIGVSDGWFNPLEDPILVEAVLSYVKAMYSVSDQYERLIGIYNMTLTKIKGNTAYRKDPEGVS